MCGANEPVIRVPRTPANFENNWTTAIADAPNWIVIETWNEIFKGTGICRTVEYGDTYIQISGNYSAMFHAQPLPIKWISMVPNWPGVIFVIVVNGFIIGIAFRMHKSKIHREKSVNHTILT